MEDIVEALAEQIIIDYNTQKRPGWILRDCLADALRAYGEACAAAQKERDAAYLEGRAALIEAGDNNYTGQWMARIFRDEAQAIRAETPPPTQE